jgi:hypothetical protein
MDPQGHPANHRISTLLGEIVDDGQDLVRQQIELLRSEIKEELRQLRSATVMLCIGGAVAALGAVFLCVMLAEWIAAATTIPLWGAYGIVGGGLGLIGLGMLLGGRKTASDVHLAPPPLTARAFKENVEWLKTLRHRKTVETKPTGHPGPSMTR